MTRPSLILVATVAAAGLTVPAAAQHSGHHMPGMTMPAPAKKKPAIKKPAAKKAVAKKPAPKKIVKAPVRKAPAKKAVAKRAAAPTRAKPAVDPHAGHRMDTSPAASATPVDPHAGHAMPSAPPTGAADPHAGHAMGGTATASGTDLPAGNAPPPPVPTDRAADAVFGAEAMHMGRHHLDTMHGGQKFSQLMVNIAEAQLGKGRDSYEWDVEGWYGGDINRLVVKSEGDGSFGQGPERAEVQGLYSRAITPYFNVQGGIRYDIRPNPSRVYAAIGLEGLAPGFFDVEGTLFVSHKGELSARAEGYYDQRITQRLILQPRAEVNFAAQNSRDILVGAGISDAEIGLRLRYDIRREFAPYVGIQYRRAFGRTRDYLRDAGEDPDGLSLLAGVRFWF